MSTGDGSDDEGIHVNDHQTLNISGSPGSRGHLASSPVPRTPAAAAKSSKSEADPEITGRRKHLGRLVEVFAENEATWDDFGSFLDFMSRKVTPCRRDYLKRYNPVIQNCRHSPEMDRGHYGWLAEKDIDFFDKKLLPKDGSFTNHCMTMGSAEKKKTTGFVVDDVCSNAREFLKALRQGNVVLGSTGFSARCCLCAG